MYVRLENKESHKAQKSGIKFVLIIVPEGRKINLYLEDEKGQSYGGLSS